MLMLMELIQILNLVYVLAGEKSFDKMVFNTDIVELVNLKCTFVIKDENTNEVLEECSIDIFKED